MASAKTITLPPEGVGPNVLARVLASQGLLAERVANAGDAQEIGKRYFRPYLRATYANVHERHAPWTLTRPQMIALMAQFGTERAKTYAKRAK